LYDYVFLFLRDHFRAEEITQDVFLAIHKAARSYQPQGKFVVWMCSIARNRCLNALEKKGIKSRSYHDMVEFAASEGKGDVHDAEENAKLIQKIVGLLSETDREIVLLRYFQDLSFKEIGEVLGLAESHVRTRLTRAIQKLRENIPDL
jgi:RNA polymerase sigma-70 factor (ECF subfamily)